MIAPVDADDLWAPGKIEGQVAAGAIQSDAITLLLFVIRLAGS
jgi:hypothetical protein